MFLVMARQGDWTAMKGWPKTLKAKLDSRGAIRIESTQVRWFLR
jgi:hypothetical protein